jgi:hypothetical protein
MSPFQVYLLLQMDSLNTGLGVLLLLMGAVILFCLIPVFIDGWTDFQSKGLLKKTCTAFLTVWGLAVVCPSTKTVAAMIVLPKLTSPQALDTMGKEGQELYGLAKKALENLADDKKKEDAK